MQVNDELLKTLEAERTGVPIAVEEVDDDATAGAGEEEEELVMIKARLSSCQWSECDARFLCVMTITFGKAAPPRT